MSLSYAHFMVTLPSGNPAVYLVQPQHLPREDAEHTKEWPIMYGEQIAVKFLNEDKWVSSKDRKEITDLKLIALLERCPKLC